MKSFLKLLMLFIATQLLYSACKSSSDTFDLSGDLTISKFSINGISGIVDNNERTILLILPPKSDVSSLVPEIEIPAGASIEPFQGMPLNFTDPVEFRLVNGNRYAVYTVNVYVIDAQITRFILDGRYQGVIDQDSRQITVSVPPSVDLTNLTPTIEISEGATLTPEANLPTDFTGPVKYTLTYMDETFEYTVNVAPRDQAFAFVGVGALATDVTSLHERNALQWMLDAVPNSSYISFDDIKNETVNLSSYDVIWFHYETTQVLPSQAYDPTVVAKFKAYHQAGGNILLTSYASQYVTTLSVTSYGPNNVFGDAVAWTVPERWGISYQGSENHPIFNGLEQASDTNYPAAYFIDENVHRRNAGCMWHIEPAPYNSNRETWAQLTGGVPLAALNWDAGRTVHVTVAEFPKITNANGGVICIGAPSYEWYNEDIAGNVSPANKYLSNMEIITKNAILYLLN